MARPRLEVCKRGHELSDETAYITPGTGQRSCRQCRALRHTVYRSTPKGRLATKARDIRESGWTLEAYNDALLQQNNSCAVCKIEFSKSPAADHDHETERRRGLLCSNCNTGLGMFKDNPTLLELAAEYLRKYGK